MIVFYTMCVMPFSGFKFNIAQLAHLRHLITNAQEVFSVLNLPTICLSVKGDSHLAKRRDKLTWKRK